MNISSLLFHKVAKTAVGQLQVLAVYLFTYLFFIRPRQRMWNQTAWDWILAPKIIRLVHLDKSQNKDSTII